MAPSDERLFISTTPGLEPALELECRALGFQPQVEPGGVTVFGGHGLHRELNLRLRTASRVLLRVAEVGAGDFGRISLERFIPRGVPTEVSASVHKTRLRADRIEELARKSFKLMPPPRRFSEDDEGADALRVQLRVDGDVCTVSVDTSGELLHRRGYRQEVSHAPLRETLAAGMLVLAGYDGSAPLLDPMCGSGTIAIEAALFAQRRAPGMDRAFAFERFPSFDDSARRSFDEL